jgi:hypothetical protein
MKGYAKVKSNREFKPLDGIDGIDETIEQDAYSNMFIERYYAFKDWFSMHLPNVYYPHKVKKHMWWVLEFMENGLDVVEDYLKIRVSEKFREMFPESKDNMTRYARVHVYEQYLHFIKHWDIGIVNPHPIIPGPIDYVNRKVPAIKELNGGGPIKYKRNYDRYRVKKGIY